MKKFCLVYGGDSLEAEISILTALKVQKELEKFSYPYMMVYLDHDGNFYTGKSLLFKTNYTHLTKFKKGNFEKSNQHYYFKTKFKKEEFDVVLLLVHGYHAEDGTLGGYFDTLKIPCIYPGLIQSALLQDKVAFKRIMSGLNIKQTKYIVLNENEFNLKKESLVIDLKYPLIVKPSLLGSSIGVNKVNNENELFNALYEGFKFDETLIIEEAVNNLKEINVALLKVDNEIIVSSLERVNDKEKVLSFIDKYDNYSLTDTHIIPADIDNKIAKKIIYNAKMVYQKLNLKSIIRFDYLLDYERNEFYLNEVNAIPGSLSYYLFENKDIKMVDLVDLLYKAYKENKKEDLKKLHQYNQTLNSLKEK